MTTLSSAAWVLHDLGLAAVFGGKLFDKVAIHPSLQAISDPNERALVEDKAWKRYSIVHAVSLATLASTWLVGRKMLSGREVAARPRIGARRRAARRDRHGGALCR
jgi:chloramphenicol 3-O-phosphotransferase